MNEIGLEEEGFNELGIDWFWVLLLFAAFGFANNGEENPNADEIEKKIKMFEGGCP